jgi:hypothetical protein
LQVDQVALAELHGDISRLVPVWYPDGVRNLDHTDEARMFITIREGVSVREVSATNVVTKGLDLPGGYRFNLVNPVTVTLRGPEEELELVTPGNVQMVADFTDIEITPGRISRPVTVSVVGFENVGAVDFGYAILAEILAYSP